MKSKIRYFITVIATFFIPCTLLSQGWNVELVSSYYDLWGPGKNVALSGNYAYVTTGITGLRVVDISDRNNPIEVGKCDIPGNALSITTSGNYAYMTCKQGEVFVYDISDPVYPSIISQLELPGAANKGVISGDYLYVANDSSGLQIIDMSNPYSPFVVNTLQTSSYAKDVDIQGDYAYLAASLAGLRIIDISNPVNPVEIASYSSDFHTDKILVKGDYAYIVDFLPLHIIDVSDPVNPTRISVCSVGVPILTFDVSDDNLYVAVSYPSSTYINGGAGIVFVNVSDPYNPSFDTTPIYRTQDLIKDITLSGCTAYVLNSMDGLRLFNITSPTDPQELGCYDTPGYCSSIAISGNYIFTSHSPADIRVMDITDPSNPFEVNSLQLEHYLSNLILQEQVIFSGLSVSWDTCGLAAIDISDPTHPVEIGRHIIRQPYSFDFEYEIAGDYAYLIIDSLHVLDISDIVNIHQVSSVQLDRSIRRFTISDDYLYTTSGGFYNDTTTVRIYSLLDPLHPFEVYSWNIPATLLYDLEVFDNYLFFTAEYDNLPKFVIFDLSKRTNPIEIGRCDIPQTAYKIKISGVHAILAAGESGTIIIDISDLTNPVEVGYYDTPGTAYDLCVHDTLVYVADKYFFEVFDISQAIENPQNPKIPLSFSLHSNYPNPFNSCTVLPYTISNGGRATLKIYNILGQKIATLFDNNQQPGHHSVGWDATDVSSGIYFAQLKSGKDIKTIKMVLLK